MFETLRSVLRFRPIETDADGPSAGAVPPRSTTCAPSPGDGCPRGVFDYIDGAAEDERTMRANSAAFADLTFRPRVLRDVGAVDPSTRSSAARSRCPLVLAPTGFTRIADPDGELAVARAAQRAGLPYTLSTLGDPLDRGRPAP